METLKPRETLDRQMKQLYDDILILGSMVEQATIKAVQALKARDVELAKRIYDGDARINEKRFEIEQSAITLIATQQPMAGDLRVLASALEINTELERMGDYAKGIGKITMDLAKYPPIDVPPQISEMADVAVDMLHRALGAFVSADEATARTIPAEDDQVDDFYNQIHRDLISVMASGPDMVDRANHMLWAAHNLERMADRVTNICERILFVTTGKISEIEDSL